MSNKVLISQAVIPQHLYVYREADRHVELLLKDMGRPGYVLVARQMGKTNLLLNAKRNLIGPNDASVYVDFSNVFRSARECFRHIVDLIIDTNPDKFYFLRESIEANREANDLADHLEHETELRKILSVLKGKLVIIIDEVDAITTVDFSDTVFKQIRSIYFASRTNFPILNNLTYILSGVGEPSNLIKDPKISPFNIGEEIFLGDFSYQEFENFLEKSRLKINNNTSERIYYWTSGSPRMTYEICSAVEDVINNTTETGSDLDVCDVDDIVHKMYLVTFDRVPIDNIRDMVQADEEMLAAIKNIKNNRFNQVTASQKRKLYLAGIVGADFEGEKVSIKNRIIEGALSSEWLQEVTKNESVISKAAIAFSNRRYDDVISILEKELDKYVSQEQFVIVQQMIVASYYNKSRFDDVIRYFNNYGHFTAKTFSEVYDIYRLESLYLHALALYHSRDYFKAAIVFRQVISSGSKRFFYFSSMLGIANLASGDYGLTEDLLGVEITDYYERIIDSLDDSDVSLSFEENQHFKAIAFYNLGLFYKRVGDKLTSFQNFKNALNVASNSYKAALFYNLSLVAATNDVSIYLEKSLKALIANNAKPYEYSIDSPLAITYVVILDLIRKLQGINKEDVIDLIHYFYREELKVNFPAEDELKLRLSKENSVAREQIVIASFSGFLSHLSRDEMIHGYEVYKNSSTASISLSKPFAEAIVNYRIVEKLDELDVVQMMFAIRSSIPSNLRFAASVIDYIRKHYDNAKDEFTVDSTMLDFFEMLSFKEMSQRIGTFKKAEAIMNSFKKIDLNKVEHPYINRATLLEVRSAAFDNYASLVALFGSSSDDKVSIVDRNKRVTVKYLDGRLLSDKFKRLEKDILKGLCRVVRDE